MILAGSLRIRFSGFRRRFLPEKSRFFFNLNFELKKILADNPLGLLLIAIKGQKVNPKFWKILCRSTTGKNGLGSTVISVQYRMVFHGT